MPWLHGGCTKAGSAGDCAWHFVQNPWPGKPGGISYAKHVRFLILPPSAARPAGVGHPNHP